MKYLVMECHLSYAVVLDEEGRFLKVANLHYEVGQTVTDVVEMQVHQAASGKKKTSRWMRSLAAMAACMVLMVTSLLHMEQTRYASVYMRINPEVRIDVNRQDVVVGLEGVNMDGTNLIEGYDYRKKNLDLVMNDLVDRAIDMDYLHEGGQISLVLDAHSEDWVVSHSSTLSAHLTAHLEEKLTVTIDVVEKEPGTDPVVIPIGPEESDYGDSDYAETEPAGEPTEKEDTDDTDYGDSDYDDGQTDYGNEDADEGVSDYDDAEEEVSDEDDTEEDDSGHDDAEEDDSDYGDAEEEAPDEGDTEEEDSDYDDAEEEASEEDDTEENDSDYDDAEEEGSDDDDSDDDDSGDEDSDYDADEED